MSDTLPDFEGRLLGCLPRTTQLGDGAFPVWGDVPETPLIPRSDWPQSFAIDDQVWHIIDQGQQGSCNAAACAGAMMLLREQAGLPRVILSQGSLYGQINGGRDQGSGIDEGLAAMMAVGICPTSVIPQYDWQPSKWPAHWKDAAAQFRVREAWDCDTVDAMVSAMLRGFPVVFGVFWSGGGGHAIVGCGWSSQGVRILNSWGNRWGDSGRGYLPESQVARGLRTFGGWALRVPTNSDGATPA